jgi:zinc D-Ala-D-Ala carboxypeptidase
MSIQTDLIALGWLSGDSDDVKNFQRGWNLGPALVVDGKVGKNTAHAIGVSVSRLHSGKPTASPHFSFREWRCSCGGHLPGCEVIRVERPLLSGLEVYRDAVRGPVSIVSGYRCRARNKQVGGAEDSQHLYGGAADVSYALPDRTVAGLHVFSGIGRSGSSHKVRHVDVRHATGHNLSHGSIAHPTIWDYAH